MKAAQAKYEAARAGLEQAQEQLEYTRVRAPYSGIVTERHIEIGETAQPGKKLVSGISLDHLRVNVDVPQSIINDVRESGSVTIESPGGDVIAVSDITVFPYAEPASHTFRVRLEFNGDGLKLFPGMFVKAVFEIGHRNVLVVPTRSIVRRSEVTAVYILSPEGHVSMRAIRKGRDLDDGHTIVLAGLQQGERVMSDPIAAGVQLKQQQ
jgi:RND family efflux transporter MFP subunit